LDRTTWKIKILLKNRLAGGWIVSASCWAGNGMGIMVSTIHLNSASFGTKQLIRAKYQGILNF